MVTVKVGVTGVISVVVILIGVFLAWLEYGTTGEEEYWRMATAAVQTDEEFLATNQSAFMVGATGETGKHILEELTNRKIFQTVTLIGRREVKYDGEKYQSIVQKVVDFDNLDSHAEVFKDHDVGFICLGARAGSAGVTSNLPALRKVDHDYVVKSAELAKLGGCRHLVLLSAMKASKDASHPYSKIKGEVEEEAKALGFDRLSIFQPAVIMVDRKDETRVGEWFLKKALAPVAFFFPTALTVPIATLARAMVNTVLTPKDKDVEVLDNKAIHRMGGKK
ncbi:oxidoreductase HTATIP2-like isoform X1 [Branchiostoma lanceolatum]|uniref:Protein HTATIP2 n=1 Tax=Branchiostoma lanceolatum TaxID=7740 RepID=A0A8J9Z7Y4_BRALA|nr:HTATIP2 [Branchiostoma lanceolatum]